MQRGQRRQLVRRLREQRQVLWKRKRPTFRSLLSEPDEIRPGHAVSDFFLPRPTDPASGHSPAAGLRLEAMKRTSKLDVLHCDHCGGRREVIALIPEGEIATRILAHLKLPVDAQGFLPIRAPPWDPFLTEIFAENDDCADDEPADLPFFADEPA